MSDRPAGVRSYQRIFRPERRIYTVDGRTLPIPGGVPLAWLAYATAAIVAVLGLAALSHLLIAAAAVGSAMTTVRLGRRRLVLPVVAAAVAGCVVCGLLLRLVDWPLRLVVLPALLATVGTQVTRDGRPAHRYALSTARVRLAGRRRLLDALAPSTIGSAAGELRVGVASDHRGPRLGRGRVVGPAVLRFAEPVLVSRGRRNRVARPLSSRRRGGIVLDELVLDDGEPVEVRR